MKVTVLLVAVSVSALFFACAPRSIPSASVDEKPSQIVVPITKTGWEAEWEKSLKEAQKEGKVVVYAATPGPALRETAPGFKKKFGITMEVLTGSPAEIRNKIVAERANGIYIQDVFITGMNSHFLTSLPLKWPDPMETEFIIPEVKDPKNWFEAKHPFGDEQKMVLNFLYYPTMNIAINTELVKSGEIASYRDLIKPQWTGKIVINDPQLTGTAFNGFSTFLENKVLDLDYFRQLAKQGPVIRDATTQVDWVAKGKYSAIIWPDTNEVRRYQEAGAPIAWIFPKEGAYLSADGAGTIMLKQRPHPNAARIFINWLLSKEGQIQIQKSMGYHSARVDTAGPEGGIDQLNTRQEGVKYYPSANLNMEWLKNEQSKFEGWAKEIFGAR